MLPLGGRELMGANNFTFEESTHSYRIEGGVIVPSTTQVLKRAGLVSFDQVQAEVLERASARGTAVHKITEFIDLNLADCKEQDIDFAPIAEEYQPYVRAWMKFKHESDVKILEVEKQIIAEVNGMPYGMTFDRVAILNGREAVLEIKTSASLEDWWGLQLASYDSGLPQCENQLHRDRYAVQLQRSGNYRLCPYTDEGEYDAFTWALALTWWMLNHKYKLN
jgi:hypothetical protein